MSDITDLNLDIDTGQIAQQTLGASAFIGDIILYVLIGLAILGAVLLIFELLKYKHRIVFRRAGINGGIKIEKFKEFKDKNGSIWWKTFKTKKKISPFADCCIVTNNKGNFYVEAYLTSSDSIIPINPNPEQNLYDKDFEAKFKPFSTSQRSLLANEFVKAEEYKKRGFGELVKEIFPYMATIILILVAFLFLPDVIMATGKVGDSLGNVANKLDDTVDKLSIIVLETERLKLEVARVQGKDFNLTIVPD